MSEKLNGMISGFIGEWGREENMHAGFQSFLLPIFIYFNDFKANKT